MPDDTGIDASTVGDAKKSRIKLVYLAGPIDLVDQETAQNWRAEAAIKLKAHGFGVFSPAHAFELPTDQISSAMALAVLRINNEAMAQCDAVLANLAGPGYGTPIELHAMVTAGIPAASFGGNTNSLYVKVWPHYKSIGKAIKSLLEQHGG